VNLERLARILTVLAVVAAFAVAVWAYPRLPAQVPAHWNAAGKVDGYASRAWGAVGLPAIMLGLAVLLRGLPRIDPLRKNVEKFLAEYHVFVAVLELFMLGLYVQTIAWALGTKISMNAVISVGLGLLFLCVAWMIGRAKRNFFIGIRTPWTLMDDEVWARTHQLGSKLFYAAGGLCLVGALVPEYTLWFLVAPALVAGLVPVFYSYFVYQQRAPKNGMEGPPSR